MIVHDEIGGLWSRWTRGFRRIRHSEDWPEFAGADWLERIMSVETNDITFRKQGRSIARWTLTAADGRQLVVFLKTALRTAATARTACGAVGPGERIRRACRNGNICSGPSSRDCPCRERVAAGELVGPHGRLQSFIAIAELTDMLPLHEAIPLAAQIARCIDLSTMEAIADR